MKTFTLEEIKNYIKQQDSLGDVMYNLSEQNITKANKSISFSFEEIMDSGSWMQFCEDYGVSSYCVNEGADENTKTEISISDAKRYGLI